MSYKLTEKQKEFGKADLKRWNIVSGATGGGKTFVCNFKFTRQIAQEITNNTTGNYLLVGRTLTTLERNVLEELHKFTKKFRYNKSSKVAYLGKTRIFLEGANDRQSGEKIRGLNLKGAYCDEVVTYPKDFMDMLKSRLRETNAWCIASCNPAHEKHWFNLEYRLNPKLDKQCWDFTIDDNEFLPKKFVEEIKKEYQGVLYQRYILGKWVNAEGGIYKINDYNIVENNSIKFEDIDFVTTGIDIGGNKSKTTFVTVAFLKNFRNIVVVESEKIDYEQNSSKIHQKFKDLLKRNVYNYKFKYKYVFVDSEAQIMRNDFIKIRNELGLDVKIKNSVKNRVLDRIYKTQQILSNGKLKIAESCKTLLEALENALWNEKSKVDERLDDGTSDIDTLDAFEYSWETWIKKV